MKEKMRKFDAPITASITIPARLMVALSSAGAQHNPPMSPDTLAVKLISEGLDRLPRRVILGTWPPTRETR